jgi:hypothetical protein
LKEIKIMSAPKTLSQLSLAAVALLVVALPTFAQTEPTDKTSAASVTESCAIVAVNRESVTRESWIEASDAETNVKAPKFSADKFMQAVNELPATTIKRSSVFLPAKPKFDDKSSARRITFAPSVKPAAPGVTQ